jgi:hypothetical protein
VPASVQKSVLESPVFVRSIQPLGDRVRLFRFSPDTRAVAETYGVERRVTPAGSPFIELAYDNPEWPRSFQHGLKDIAKWRENRQLAKAA